MPEYVCPPPPVFSATILGPPAPLEGDQLKLYDLVLAHFSADEYALSDETDGKLTETEKYWLSYECILRYLRAVKWESAPAAIKRLESTLKWRREFGYETNLTPEHVEPEATTGKEVIYGYDTAGRPAMYLRPSRQNTEESHRQVEFVFFMTERAIDLMGPGVETLSLMIDLADKAKNPSMGQSRKVLNILQTHYPERLGRALILNLPWVVNMFFKLIMPFVDPVTRPKIRFNPKPIEDKLFTADQLLTGWGGTQEFEYEHDKYWPDLMKTCADRRDSNMARWRALGGTIGIREWDYKGGAGSVVEASVEASTDVGSVQPVKEADAVSQLSEKGSQLPERVPDAVAVEV